MKPLSRHRESDKGIGAEECEKIGGNKCWTAGEAPALNWGTALCQHLDFEGDYWHVHTSANALREGFWS